MKKLIGLLTVAVMLFGAMGLSGCTPEEKVTGKFYTLQEAYDAKLLTVQDLQVIAAHHNENTAPSDTLSDAKVKAIKETYRNSVIDMPKASLDGILILKYYGTYNGNIAINITDEYHGYDYVIADELDIGGVIFYKIHNASIRIWNDKAE